LENRRRSFPNAPNASTIRTGISPPTRGVGASWPQHNRAGARVEPSIETIRQGVKQAEVDEGQRSGGLTTSDREELNRLRRENRVLREEREILSKAAAWFAQQTGATLSRRSHS
jgi:hypothetical protein